MTQSNIDLSFRAVLKQLTFISNMKVGDRWPPFLSKTGKDFDWGPPLANLARCAAAHLQTTSDRVSEVLSFANKFEERARQAERAMKDLLRARPIEEYHEDMGDVLWWKFPITEPPYIGSPLDLGNTIEVTVSVGTVTDWPEPKEGPNGRMTHYNIGGWPGYHTHWTPLPDASKIVKP